MAAIQFFRGVDETVIPDIRMTRSRDGATGQAIFVFEEPDALGPEITAAISGMFLVDEEWMAMLKRKPPNSMTNPPAIHQGVTMALLESNGL